MRIKDEIYRRAKARSAELGLSLPRFFEEAVEEPLMHLEERAVRRTELPVSSVSGSTVGAAELKRRMESAQLKDDLSSLA